MTDINKYDKKTLDEYWAFVNQLNYDCLTSYAYTAKCDIMKQLSPTLSELYKDVTDALAFSLYREVYCDKKNTYLYACYDAISKGRKFYEECWCNPELIKDLESRLNADIIQEHNFSNVFPIEDDFYTDVQSDVITEFYEDDLEDISKFSKGKKDCKKFDQLDDDL